MLTGLPSATSHLTRVSALLGALALVACSNTGAGPEDGAPITTPGEKVTLANGLTQAVTLSPASPASGSNVEVRSVLVNEGAAPVDLSSRICGLDYAGTLELTHPPEVMKCAGYSQSSTIAPGDTVQVGDLMRVASGAGAYELRVRHALDPERWVSLQVVVRAP
jgi:hypothetical protein